MPRSNVREQLLSAGLKTLHRQGFHATSVQDITEAAGVPKGSFYNHFDSKETLGAEAVLLFLEAGAARLNAVRDTKVAPVTRLRRYFEDLNNIAVNAGFSSGCLLGNFGAELSDHSAVIRTRVAEAFKRQGEALATAIDEGQQKGQVARDFTPEALAGFLINAWEGAILRAKVEKDRAPLDLFMDVTFTKLLS